MLIRPGSMQVPEFSHDAYYTTRLKLRRNLELLMQRQQELADAISRDTEKAGVLVREARSAMAAADKAMEFNPASRWKIDPLRPEKRFSMLEWLRYYPPCD